MDGNFLKVKYWKHSQSYSYEKDKWEASTETILSAYRAVRWEVFLKDNVVSVFKKLEEVLRN